MTPAILEVLRPGLQTIVVAAPRLGHRHIGVGLGGALDEGAFALANERVGNPVDAPALEIVGGGFAGRFSTVVAFAITGAECGVHYDGATFRLETRNSVCEHIWPCAADSSCRSFWVLTRPIYAEGSADGMVERCERATRCRLPAAAALFI